MSHFKFIAGGTAALLFSATGLLSGCDQETEYEEFTPPPAMEQQPEQQTPAPEQEQQDLHEMPPLPQPEGEADTEGDDAGAIY